MGSPTETVRAETVQPAVERIACRVTQPLGVGTRDQSGFGWSSALRLSYGPMPGPNPRHVAPLSG
jgi:hypothetical protein